MLFRVTLMLLLGAIHGFFLYSTNSLEQINRDELFLDKVQLENFRHFQEKIGDAPLVAMDIASSSDISSQIPQVFEKLDFISSRGVIVRSYFDIYQKKVKRDKINEAIEFADQHPDLTFPFLSRNHMTILFFLPREWSWKQNNDFVSELVEKFQIQNTNISFTGTPYINYLLNLKSKDIKTEIFPILFSICFILSLFVIRNLIGALLVFIPSLFAAATTLMISKILFGELNMITSIIPVLNFILNLTLGYHLYCTFLKEKSMTKVFQRKMAPIFLMIITTAIGFGSLYFSQVEAIRQMSVTSSFGLILTCAIHLLWAYLSYELIDQRWKLTVSSQGADLVQRFRQLIPSKVLFYGGIIAGLLGLSLIPKIPVMTEAAHYFSTASGIQASFDKIQKERLGNPNYDIIIPLKESEQTYEKFKAIEIWEQELLRIFPQHKLLSMNHFIAEANGLYSGDFKLPENQYAFNLMKGSIDPDLKDGFLNDSIYRLTLAGPFLSNEEFIQKNNEITHFLNTHSIPAQVGGLYYTLRMSQNTLILILFKSFTMSLFIILLLAFFHFKKLKVLFSFFLANVIPSLAALFFMWVTGLTINIATVMTFSISIGIIVDGSFHIAHSVLNRETEDELIKESLVPIFMSSAILILSFLVFGFYGFLPIRHFGLTLALNIFLGLLFDLKVLPWLLKDKAHVA